MEIGMQRSCMHILLCYVRMYIANSCNMCMRENWHCLETVSIHKKFKGLYILLRGMVQLSCNIKVTLKDLWGSCEVLEFDSTRVLSLITSYSCKGIYVVSRKSIFCLSWIWSSTFWFSGIRLWSMMLSMESLLKFVMSLTINTIVVS